MKPIVIAALLLLPTAVAAAPEDDPSWRTRALEEIARSEYRFSRTAKGLEAPNRAHGFRVRVEDGAVHVVSRLHDADAASGGFSLAWRTARWGRPGALETLAPLGVSEDGGTLRLAFGPVVETLENDGAGLKQGFEIAALPPGGRDAGLVIEADVETGLLARPSEDGGRIDWTRPDGRSVLSMTGLSVFDATGAALRSRFEVGAGLLAIVVDDRDAVYPIVVDPLLTAPSWSVESNQAGAFFGAAVATAGDVNGDGFSDVLVGAYDYDGGQTNEGRIFLYLGSASGLSTTAARTFESDQAEANLGWSVSPAGDLNADGFDDFVAGANDWDGGQTDEGRVYVYRGAATSGGIALALTLEADQAGADFGYALAYAGDVDGDGDSDLVVGAPNFSNGQASEGAMYVYFGDPAAVISSAPPFRYESGQAGANLGISVGGGVDVDADSFSDVIAGAFNWDTAITGAGRAVAFYGSATGFAATPDWIEDGVNGSFGKRVAGVGDVDGDGYADVAVSADGFDGTFTNEGRIYVYRGSSTGLAATPATTRDGVQAGAQLGSGLAAAGDVNGDGYADVAAGANGWDEGGTANAGQVRVWHGGPGGLAANPSWTFTGTQAQESLGADVFAAGDVNGDGFGDLLVGASGWDGGQTDEGRALVFHGSGDGVAATEQVTLGTNDPSGSGTFGWVVASAGDVNADGFSDVIVGAPFHRLGGATWVYLGSATGIGATPDVEILGSVNDGQFGFGVAGVGDVNGDGYDDVAVGAPRNWYDANRDFYAGRVYVYYGGASGVDAAADFAYPNSSGTILFDDRFGETICRVGDANGDGFSDFYVGGERQQAIYGGASGPAAGAAGTTPIVSYAGSCSGADVNRDGYADVLIGDPEDDRYEITAGGPGGLQTQIWSTYASDSPFRAAVAMAGDVNGDGHVDVVTSSDPVGGSTATLELYFGSPTGPDTTADQTWSVADGIESMSSAGDVNGDGYSDLIVGSTLGAGRAQVFLGSASGLATTPAFVRNGTSNGDEMGRGVAGDLDVNGDGFSDVAIGESGRADGFAYVHLGGGGDGLDLIPRNWRWSADVVVSLSGKSDDDDRFRIRSRGRTAKGRGRVAMDHQIAAVGLPISGGALTVGSFFDTGTTDSSGAGINFTRSVTGLAPETPYKWRMRFRAKDPVFPVTRWISLPGNTREETDLRTTCTALTWYRDADGDGFGTSATTQSACSQPSGFVAASGDCDDADPAMFPGNPEVCDGKDNDCAGGVDDGFAAPEGRPRMTASKSGLTITLAWPRVSGADRYDVVRGGLSRLRSTVGDFTAATTACVANDTTTTSASDGTDPSSGGLWYLARAVNCNTAGTYDDPAPPQSGARDNEIKASGAACP
jgi:hypothetical protein